MSQIESPVATALLDKLVEELAERLAPRMLDLIDKDQLAGSPWLTTLEAIEYSRVPEGTFRKLAASGRIPSHGGRTKVFYRPEIDQALLDYQGIAEDERQLRRVR